MAAVAGAVGGAALGFVLGATSKRPVLPPIQEIGTLAFSDYADLATRVMSVTGQEAQFIPTLLTTGFENGGAHYIYGYYWPFQNPQDTALGQVTKDIGLIADLWVRPNNVWAVELANFDYDPTKVVYFTDGVHPQVAVPVLTTAFLSLTQETTS